MTVIDKLIKYHKKWPTLLNDGGISIFAMVFQKSPQCFLNCQVVDVRDVPMSFRMNNQLYIIFQNNSCETIFFVFLETFNMITNLCTGWGVEGLSKVIGRRKTDSNLGEKPNKTTNRQTTIHRDLIPILCKGLNWQEMHSLRIQLMLSIFLKCHKKWWKMLQNICTKSGFPWQPA
jgi:hypothetical protein